MKKNNAIKIYLHYVLKKKWMYILTIVAVLFMAVIDAYTPYLSGKIVDDLNLGEYVNGYTMILVLIGSFVVKAIIEQIQMMFDGRIDVEVLDRAPKVDYVKKIQSLDYAFHSSKSTGSLISISSRINGALYRLFNNIRDMLINFSG